MTLLKSIQMEKNYI